VGSQDHKLYALRSASAAPGLAPSSWPMFRHDARHTGRGMALQNLNFLYLLFF
jgi:hypothetical protein